MKEYIISNLVHLDKEILLYHLNKKEFVEVFNKLLKLCNHALASNKNIVSVED